MYKVNSIDKVTIPLGTVIMINCPVENVGRDSESLREAIGPEIEIDGVVYKPIAYEMAMPAYPIRKEEVIGVLVCPAKPEWAELTTVYVNPQTIEDIKKWKIVEKDTRPPIFGTAMLDNRFIKIVDNSDSIEYNNLTDYQI